MSQAGRGLIFDMKVFVSMAESQNSEVDYACKATSMMGLSTYGDIMVGDRALEFYNERNPEDFIQIPWDQIDYISASVIFKKHISRWAVFTKENGHYTFSTRDNKATLRAIREHFDANKMLRSPSFFDVVKEGFIFIVQAISKPFRHTKQDSQQD